MTKFKEFKRTTNAFCYVFSADMEAGDVIIVDMPPVSPNKRGINDIGWISNGDVKLYGTLSAHPEKDEALWQEILPEDDINKTVSAIKIENNGGPCRIEMRALLC